jgi:hypothetical protein
MNIFAKLADSFNANRCLSLCTNLDHIRVYTL